MENVASKAQAFIASGGSAKAIGTLADSNFTNLGALAANDLLGADQLVDDWYTLDDDWHKLK
jgi:hypothetical protein